MNRRNFLSLIGIGVAGVALDQAIPLGRVWSFPSQVIIPKLRQPFRIEHEWITKESLAILRNHFEFFLAVGEQDLKRFGLLKIGDVITIASVNRINPPN